MPPFVVHDQHHPASLVQATAHGRHRSASHGVSTLLGHGPLMVEDVHEAWHAGYQPLFVAGASEMPMNSEQQQQQQPQITMGDLSARQGPRNSFPSSSVTPLREWFAQNQHYPYPNKQAKQELSRQAGLSLKQVNSWFINARKRRLPRSSEGGEPSQRPLTASPDLLRTPSLDPRGNLLTVSPDIGASESLSWDGYSGAGIGHFVLDAANRHLRSDGEGDLSLTSSSLASASLAASDATFRLDGGNLSLTSSRTGSEYSHSNTGMSSTYASAPQSAQRGYAVSTGPNRTPSSASMRSASSMSEVSSIAGYPTHWLARANLHHDVNTRSKASGSSGDPRRRVVGHETAGTSTDAVTATVERSGESEVGDSDDGDSGSRRAGEIFQCTFPNCGKSFGSKTWKRHEETKHLPRVQWTCMSTGFIVDAPPPHHHPSFAHPQQQGRRKMCAFCHQLDPDPYRHPAECAHRLTDCLSRPHAERTFHRKDHLFQHLRNFHRIHPSDTAFGADWKHKVERVGRTWGCGFCGERLGSWERRARHLRTHFRDGWRVERDWDERKARMHSDGASA